MGILNAIFAPFIVLYFLMYSFFRYFEVGDISNLVEIKVQFFR
jgi:Autophagy protein ATG9